jgi:hypothetical protein
MFGSPGLAALQVFARRSVITAAMNMRQLQIHRMEFLAPNERTTMSAAMERFAPGIEAQIKPRLAGAKTKDAA